MGYDAIKYEVTNGYATITLNRPDRLNAVTAGMLGELVDALDRIAADDDIRCLLLTGEGRGFCAGQDLNDRDVSGDARPDLSKTLNEGYHPVLSRLHVLEIPTIAAINGVAAGAGANIALVCDIVLAAESAKFIQAFCKIGLVPDSGGTYNLPRLVGMARAKGLAMLGDALDAKTAEDWGMIWKAVPGDALMQTAHDMAAHFATAPTWGLSLTKRALNASFANSFEDQLALEAECQKLAGDSDDYVEGITAFFEKRRPEFTGKKVK